MMARPQLVEITRNREDAAAWLIYELKIAAIPRPRFGTAGSGEPSCCCRWSWSPMALSPPL